MKSSPLSRNSHVAYLHDIEEALLNIRGYISRLPENKKVVVVFSGGLDSVSTIARCIIDFDLEVFPINILRGQSNVVAEKRAVEYFDSFFRDKFPKKYHHAKVVETEIPPSNFKKDIKEYADMYGYPLRDNLLEAIALQYATSLWAKGGEITSIYTGIVPEDVYSHSSLQAMRSTTLMACVSTPLTSWNISSVNVDPLLYGIHGPFSKPDEIRWCKNHDIPIHLSHTCNTGQEEHCGTCGSCKKRHAAFEKAGIPDKTIYLRPITP